MDDLDDLLDDIEIDHSLDEEEDADVAKIKPTLAALPDEMKMKWVKTMVEDMKADTSIKFMRSHEYRSWEDSKNIKKSVKPHRLLQDAIRNTCVKCNFDESKMSKLLNLVNPLISDSGKQLQDSYNKQLLSDLKKNVLSDPDYNDGKSFPELAKYYH